jgi:hypothetical protein
MFFCITNVLAGSSINNATAYKITKEGLQEAEGLEEEPKVSSFLWLDAFPLELIPLQPLQDHRDGDAETVDG